MDSTDIVEKPRSDDRGTRTYLMFLANSHVFPETATLDGLKWMSETK